MEGGNVNLTRILQKLVSCEHVGDVEWYTNGSQLRTATLVSLAKTRQTLTVRDIRSVWISGND